STSVASTSVTSPSVASTGGASASATTAGGATSVVTPPSAPETINSPAGTNDAVSAAPQASSGPVVVADIATIMHIVLAFEAVEAQPAVLVNNHGVIFYDEAAINSQFSAVKSIT